MPKLSTRTNWADFLKTAAWIVPLISAFIVTPPLLSRTQDPDIRKLVTFLIAALLALIFIPMKKRSAEKYSTFWLIASVITFGLFLLLAICYFIAVNNWSVDYYGVRLVKGQHMSAEAVASKATVAKKMNLPWVDDDTFVKSRAGDTQYIWPMQELKKRYYILSSCYIAGFLILSFFIISISHAIECFMKDRVRLKKEYLMVLLSLLSIGRVHAQDHLEERVRTEFEAIRSIAFRDLLSDPGVFLQFDYSEQMNTESLQKGRVIINLHEIRYLLRQVPDESVPYIVRFIVAHEIAHQVQFASYKDASLPPLTEECQADLLAGIYTFQITLQEYFKDRFTTIMFPGDIQSMSDKFHDNMLTISAWIYRQGDDFSKDNTHPRNEQRRLALRDGYAFGKMWMDDMISHYSARSAIADQAKDLENHLKYLLDYQTGDNVITWSRAHAQNIVHNNNSNWKDIAVYSTFYPFRDKPDHWFTFTHKIKNIGSHRIQLYFPDQMFSASKTDPHNSQNWTIVAIVPHTVTLMPGEVTEVSGEIQGLDNDTETSQYVRIGDKSSLYMCTSDADRPHVSRYTPGIINAELHPSKENVYDVILSESDRLDSYIDGIGQVVDDDFSVVYFRSKLNIPGAVKTRVIYNVKSRTYRLAATLYTGVDRNVALRQLDELKKILKKIRSGLHYVMLPGAQGFSRWDLYNRNNHMVGQIDLVKQAPVSNYSLTFSITGK